MRILKQSKRIICLMLCIFAVLFLFFANYENVSAASETGTVVVSNELLVRSGPGTENTKLGYLKTGTTVTIVSKGAYDKDGNEWYVIASPKIYKSNGVLADITSGYVMGKYVIVEPNVEYSYDGDFEAWLSAQGFPESYKPYLRELHAKYPNWVFKAAKTGLNWSDVIASESKAGRTLIGSSYPSSWKSMEQGCYDFSTGRYITYDSGGWVTAAKNVVEYYMDPRNFLDSTGIFQFLTHSFDASTQTISGLTDLLSGTFMEGSFPESSYSTWAEVIYKAGQTYGVNPYVLASMIIVEQGSNGGGGCITSGTGYYNFFNVGAYRTSTMTAVQRGLWYAKQSGSYGRPWNSRVKSIMGGAEFYATNYVNENKNTLYFKKWNVMNGLSNVGTYQYMSNVLGASLEANQLRNGYSTSLSTAMTFLIPVYENMPASPCPEPSSSNDNNNFLSSLTVSGYELTPEFNMYVTTYELVVGTGVTSITVGATQLDQTATIEGLGTYTLTNDDTAITIKVVASSGTTKSYNLLVSKMFGGQTLDTTVSLESDSYIIGEYITGVSPNTDYSTFMSHMNASNGSIVVTNANDGIITSGLIGTGYSVLLYDKVGSLIATYTVKINGDINCDGKISTADLLLMQKHIVGNGTLNDIQFASSDINQDGKISTADLLYLRQSLVGSYEIAQ